MLGRFQRARRKVLNRLSPYKAVLGDASSNVYAGEGLYWVRPYDSADANNIATPGTPYRVQSGVSLVVPRAGRVVWIGYGLDNRLTVLGYDHADLVKAGINPSSAQPNDPYREWIRLKNIQNFRALPIATGTSPSLLVQVRQLFYYTPEGDMVRWNGTNADMHIDLAAYVPITGFQRYVILWLRVYNPNGLSDIQVTYSTPISSIDSVLSFTDLQECSDLSDADTIPIGAFRLANAQVTLKIDDSIDVDLRQFINMPQVFGFPNTVHRAYRVHEDFSVVAPSAIIIEDGGLVQVQDNALLLILSETEDESGGGSGVTSVSASAPLSSTGGTTPVISHNTSGISAGVHPYPASITYNNTGHATSITDGTAPTSPPFVDTTSIVKGSADATKLLRFEVDGFSTATTRVMTPPNYDGTIATLAGIETQTNKTFTSPVINTGVSGSAIIDDATFASPSSTTVPTTNAVKDFVAQTVLGLNAKADVRLATVAVLPTVIYANGSSGIGATLTAVSIGVLTIDGVTVALNDRLLIKDQAAGLQNGIYRCTVAGAIGVAFVLTRTTDADTDSELRGGWMIATEGTVNATQAFVNTNTSAITFGTTVITFGEFSAGVIAAGTGLTKTGNTLSLIVPVTIANGGTNATTKTDAFDSLAPTTTQGDMIYHNGTDNVRLAKGTALQLLRMNAGATAEEWAAGLIPVPQYFSASGTYTKPLTAVWIEVYVVGAGAGGASGRRGAAGSVRGGGGGGGAGAATWKLFPASMIDTGGTGETVTIGTGGAGGAVQTTNDSNGNDGNNGGNTYFGGTDRNDSKLAAIGGLAGIRGATAGGAGGLGNTTVGPSFQVYGSDGTTGGAAASANAAQQASQGPGAGGGGGGITTLNASTNGGQGAFANRAAFAEAASGGTTAGSNGAGGTTTGASPFIYGAGGGGGTPAAGAGRAGGNGGAPGGGGGGGSASLNGNNSGVGGNGADGGVFIVAYCFG